MKKLIIFDVDGVFHKEEKLIIARKVNQIKYVSKKNKISIKDAEKLIQDTKNSLSKEKSHTSVYILEKLGIKRDEYFKIIDEVDPTGIIELYEGCKKVLNHLTKKHIIVTLSNTPRHALEKTLEVLNLSKFITRNYTSEDFNESKPSTKILNIIMGDFNYKPENTIMVGNSLEKDIMPAHKIGIKTILFDPNNKYEETNYSDHKIKELIEIINLV